VTFGANKEYILNEPETVLWVIAGCLVRVVAVAVVIEFLLRLIKVGRDSRIPLLLLSIWKNTALAMSMTMILITATASALPAAISLPLEMVWFMVLLWYFKKRCPPSPGGQKNDDAT
jgi:ACR3 family arsenite efflux pump ArsB